MAMDISGRNARLVECRACGFEAQMNWRQSSVANHTGDAHGRPAASAVARVMKALARTIASKDSPGARVALIGWSVGLSTRNTAAVIRNGRGLPTWLLLVVCMHLGF